VTPATIATQEAEQVVTVATVATVTVAVNPEPSRELTAEEESRIRVWLAHIEELDPDIIADLLAKCRVDSDARRYFLKRAEEIRQNSSNQ
jgi:hypothetical protein